jgi:hypothetical protein
MTASLTFTPIRDGYAVVPTYPVVEVQLDGGIVRKKLDPLFLPHEVTVNWRLNPLQYTNFMGFFRTTLQDATEAFLMDLVTDIGFAGGIPHRCRTKEGMPKLTQVNGSCFYVSSVLEVEVNPTYTDLILYEEPNLVILNNLNPRFVGPLQPGDTIQIINTDGTHPSGSTPLNLDGEYEIDAIDGNDQIELVSPASVNAGWTTLATLGAPGQYGTESFGNVISTVVRIPT